MDISSSLLFYVLGFLYSSAAFCINVSVNIEINVVHIIRLKQLETRTWLWVDCRNPTKVDTSLRSAVWHLLITPELIGLPERLKCNFTYTASRSAVWLLIYWTKCHTSKFVIVLSIRSNCASEYTPDRAQQVSKGNYTIGARNVIFVTNLKMHPPT